MAQKTISNFNINTTKLFKLYVRFDEYGTLTVKDISADTATLYLKENEDDDYGDAKFTKVGDCASEGATGYIIFLIEPADTEELTPDKYFCRVRLERISGAKYILIDQEIMVGA